MFRLLRIRYHSANSESKQKCSPAVCAEGLRYKGGGVGGWGGGRGALKVTDPQLCLFGKGFRINFEVGGLAAARISVCHRRPRLAATSLPLRAADNFSMQRQKR